jgi:hypothetical protein
VDAKHPWRASTLKALMSLGVGRPARRKGATSCVNLVSRPEQRGIFIPGWAHMRANRARGRMTATYDAKSWFVLVRGKQYGPYTYGGPPVPM